MFKYFIYLKFRIRYIGVLSHVNYIVKVLNYLFWASCNMLDQKMGCAAKEGLILSFVQLLHQRLVLCTIFSAKC